jgi:membrane protease YdiL (CAAX protease family)
MKTSIQRYLKRSSEPYTATLLVLPLFVIYQVGILLTGGVRNGVDFMTDLLFLAADNELGTYLIINVGLLVAFVAAVFVLRKRGEFKLRVWPWVIAESTVYASLLGTTVILLMQQLGLQDLPFAAGAGGQREFVDILVLSLGAGIYEEIVFRVALMGGLFWVAHSVLGWGRWVGAFVAVVASSFVFSWVHYIGPMGDAFEMQSFLFRFFAGGLLALIFHLRGFAVVVYTHAIYDILVMAAPG